MAALVRGLVQSASATSGVPLGQDALRWNLANQPSQVQQLVLDQQLAPNELPVEKHPNTGIHRLLWATLCCSQQVLGLDSAWH